MVYYSKMAKVIYDEELLICHFYENLTGLTLNWYTSLNGFEMKKWEYMVDAFLKRFMYGLKKAPTRFDLQGIMMRNDESIRKYALRLRKMATQTYLFCA